MTKQEVTIFWFRRDLRLEDNVALYHALQSKYRVIPLFIFDTDILNSLPKNDARVSFIYESLQKINTKLNAIGSSLLIKKGTTTAVWDSLFDEFSVSEIFFNKDYEPYAIKRDLAISALAKENNALCFSFKDQVIFEENEITKSDGLPYTIYTPYKNKWLDKYKSLAPLQEYFTQNYLFNFYKNFFDFPSLQQIGFELNDIKVIPYNLTDIANY